MYIYLIYHFLFIIKNGDKKPRIQPKQKKQKRTLGWKHISCKKENRSMMAETFRIFRLSKKILVTKVLPL